MKRVNRTLLEETGDSLRGEEDRVGAVQNASDMGSRICENLLQCSRRLKLYPQGHPRVQECVQVIKSDLATYSYETGRPFSLNTSATLEESGRATGKKTEVAEVAIGRSLKLHLVESIVLLPEAADYELIQFCSLLERDLAKITEEPDDDAVDPDEWESIRLSFYTPKDYPGVFPTAGAPLERAAGVRRLKDIQALVEGLSESVRAPLEKALTDSTFLEKVSSLRRAMRRQHAPWESKQGKRVDLFGEVLRSVLSSPELEKDPASAPGKVLAAVQSLVEFLEKNIDGLSLNLRTLQDGQGSDSLNRQIQAALGTGTDLSSIVNAVQTQKQRLAFLFHTASESGTQTKEAAGQRSEAKPEQGGMTEALQKPEGEGRQQDPAASLQERLRSVSYDATKFTALAAEDDPHENYVRIVQELLLRDEQKAAVAKLRGTIAQTIVQTSSSESCLERSVAALCEFQKATEVKSAEDLIVEVLYRVSPVELTLKLLENVVLKIGGPMRAATCLIRLTEKEPRKAVALLFATHRSSQGTLKSIAEARLIGVAAHPDLVVYWAKEYPEGLMLPGVITKVLGGLGSERTLKAFRLFFASANDTQASRIITELPPDIPEGESVLFAAIESAPASVRNLAIANLGKYPTPAVTATLTEILKANNYKRNPDMNEVEATLKALTSIKDHRAKAFLREVLEQRSGIMRVYRKEIRKALLSLATRRKAVP